MTTRRAVRVVFHARAKYLGREVTFSAALYVEGGAMPRDGARAAQLERWRAQVPVAVVRKGAA